MSCKDRQECERLKNIEHASVLASQQAHLLNKRIAVVKLNHQHYGDYYKGIDYAEAERKKLKIYRDYAPGKSMKKPKPVAKKKKSDKSR